ncbi:hypothetical protein LCGC14_2254920, partial [marine sediment metagenome]
KKNLAIIILAIVLAVSGIGNIILGVLIGGVEVTPPEKEVLIIGTGSGPADLDPTDAWDSASNDVIMQVAETLFFNNLSDPDMPLLNWLAESYTWESPTLLEITLRTGVKFHDGTAFNADAAIWNFERLYYFMNHSGELPSGTPVAKIQEDDVIIFFNFRTDRGRQLTEALSQRDFHEQNMHHMKFHYVTLTNYDQTFKDIHVIYEKDNIKDTLGSVLEKHGKKQIRIAETEKYPHVTFFFNGGREEPFEGEQRLLCPSPKVATYDLQPEMSAYEIRDEIIPELQKGEVDFVCLNFANPDMVGHTGDMDAAIKACETVDKCAKDVITAATQNGYSTIVIADHGNCETMVNSDGSPNTAHTTNPVPLILVDEDLKEIKDGVLGDIAPTILKMMGIAQPELMTRKALV